VNSKRWNQLCYVIIKLKVQVNFSFSTTQERRNPSGNCERMKRKFRLELLFEDHIRLCDRRSSWNYKKECRKWTFRIKLRKWMRLQFKKSTKGNAIITNKVPKCALLYFTFLRGTKLFLETWIGSYDHCQPLHCGRIFGHLGNTKLQLARKS
jgi:hypothetical protein